MSRLDLSATVVRSSARAVSLVLGENFDEDRRLRISDAIIPIVFSDAAKRLFTELQGREAADLGAYLSSPELDNLVLQLAVMVASKDETPDSMILVREQLRSGIRLRVDLVSDRLDAVTDLINQAITTAVHNAYTLFTSTRPRTAWIATANNNAAAAARNCKLLSRLTSAAAAHEFAANMRNQVIAIHGKMRVPHAGINRAVSYDELYVQPQLRKDLPKPSKLTLHQLNKGYLHSVVLGDPGAGKSTLASKLAYDLALDNLSDMTELVPFLLVLRDVISTTEASKRPLIDHISAQARNYGLGVEPDSIEYLLLNGLSYVILDGLDELTDAALRIHIVRLIEGFVARYPLTRMLVTSRSVGYTEAALDSDIFPATLLAPFEEYDVSEYARKSFEVLDSAPPGEQTALIQAFMLDSELVADLRTNPLILSLLCGMYSTEHYIPRNRPDVYEKCAEMLFERWDRSRGIQVPLPFAAHVRPAVQRLALSLLADPHGRQAMPRSELSIVLAKYLRQKRFDDEDEAWQAAQEFLDFCAGRAWVLSEVGSTRADPLYGFTHRTFLEYFAARQLIRMHPDPNRLFEALVPRLRVGEWEVVGQLALQLIDKMVEDGADLLIGALLDNAETLEVDEKSRLLAFAARSMEFVVPGPAILADLVKATTMLSLTVPAEAREGIPDDREALRQLSARVDAPISQVSSCTSENSDRIARVFLDVLPGLIGKPDYASRAILIAQGILQLPRTGRRDARALVAAPLKGELVRHGFPATWSDGRIPSRLPSLVRQRGPGMLYHSFAFAGAIFGTSARSILANALETGIWGASQLDAMRQLCPALVDAPRPWLDVGKRSASQLVDAIVDGALAFHPPPASEELATLAWILVSLPLFEMDARRSRLNTPLSGHDCPSLLHDAVSERAGEASASRLRASNAGDSPLILTARGLVHSWASGSVSFTRSAESVS